MTGQLAGEDILASDVVKSVYYKKAADEVKTTTAGTPAADADLAGIPLAGGKVYKIELYAAVITTTATGDFCCDWDITGGVALLAARSCSGPTLPTTDVTGGTVASPVAAATTVGVNKSSTHLLATDVFYGGAVGGGTSAIREVFLVETVTAGTSGTLTFRWAQGVASGSTTLQAQTFLIVTELEAG